MAFYFLSAVVLGSVLWTLSATQQATTQTYVAVTAFLLVGACIIAVAYLKSRKGSPHYCLELTSATIEERAGRTARAFRWSEIGPFAVTEIYMGGGDPSPGEIDHWVTASIADGDAISISAKDYVSGDNPDASRRFASWLNTVREQLVGPHGVDVRRISLPSGLWEEPVFPTGRRKNT